jgi:hypothetical protein
MTRPVHMSARDFRRLTKDKPLDIHKTTSEFMLEYVRRVEKILGRRLTPDEARRITPEALAYAKTLRNWIPRKTESK